MNKNTIFYNLLFSVFTLIFASHSAFGGRFDFFKFNSNFERESFYAKDLDDLKILMAMGTEANDARYLDAKREIDEFVIGISGKCNKITDEAKKIKLLTAEIPKRFLKYYAAQTDFHFIFERGEYNCVSSTALYALIFDQLKIPYVIKETPNHVYLVAYPKSLGIMVESTAPKNAYYMPKSKEVNAIVEYLVSYEMITEEELKNNGYLSVFNRYFYKDKVISLRELTGLQYFNEALTLRLDNVQNAAAEIEKADFLCNSKESEVVKLIILSSLLETAKWVNYTDAYYLSQYASIEGSSLGNLRYSYDELVNDQMLRKNNKPFVDSVFAIMNEFILREEALDEVKILHYVLYSEYYRLKYNDTEALKYAEKAYKINPNDVYVQSNFVMCLLNQLNIDDVEDFDYLSHLDSVLADKPELKDHNLMQLFYFEVYTELSSDAYMYNDEKEGKMYFDNAIKAYEKLDDKSIIDQKTHGFLYAEAGAYYYRQKKLDVALALIQEGLKILPNSRRLNSQLNIILNKGDMDDEDFDDDY